MTQTTEFPTVFAKPFFASVWPMRSPCLMALKSILPTRSKCPSVILHPWKTAFSLEIEAGNQGGKWHMPMKMETETGNAERENEVTWMTLIRIRIWSVRGGWARGRRLNVPAWGERIGGCCCDALGKGTLEGLLGVKTVNPHGCAIASGAASFCSSVGNANDSSFRCSIALTYFWHLLQMTCCLSFD